MSAELKDVVILADAIVQAWEQSPHQFECTYQHQLQMAQIAASFIINIANEDVHSIHVGERKKGAPHDQ